MIVASPPDALRGSVVDKRAHSAPDLPGCIFAKSATYAPTDTGATLGGLTTDPMRKIAMHPEGMNRGATAVDTDLKGKMSIDDTTVPLATSAKLATRAAEILAT